MICFLCCFVVFHTPTAFPFHFFPFSLSFYPPSNSQLNNSLLTLTSTMARTKVCHGLELHSPSQLMQCLDSKPHANLPVVKHPASSSLPKPPGNLRQQLVVSRSLTDIALEQSLSYVFIQFTHMRQFMLVYSVKSDVTRNPPNCLFANFRTLNSLTVVHSKSNVSFTASNV